MMTEAVDNPGQIERFAGRDERQGAVGKTLVQRGDMQMFVRTIDQVGMDFVGQNQHVVFDTQLADAGQLFPREYPSGRVVGIGHQKDFGLCEFAIEVFEVDLVMIPDQPNRIVEHGAVVEAGLAGKGMVNRRLDHHAVAGLGEGSEGQHQTGHDSRYELQPGWIDFPAIPTIHPLDDRLPIGVAAVGIAQDRVLQAAGDGFQNRWRRGKIHIGHPHGNHITTAENALTEIVFFTKSALSGDHCIEIVFHGRINGIQR